MDFLRKAFYWILFSVSLIAAVRYFFSPEVAISLLTTSPYTKFELFHESPKKTFFNRDQRVFAHASLLPPSPYPEVRFYLPFGVSTARIRVDFGVAPDVYFNLREISVIEWGGFRKRILSPYLFSSRISLTSQLAETPHAADCLCFKTTGTDPYAIIQLEELPSVFVFSAGGAGILLLLMISGLLLLFNAHLFRIEESIWRWANYFPELLRRIKVFLCRISPYYVLPVVFAVCVMTGITGSSIGLIRNGCISEIEGEHKLAGEYRGIRSDEFIAHGTASAIQNYNHNPRFPLINRNIGVGGRNFLFLHDWGAPVRHPAMIIRPANWGFFFFGLRQSLSWYWCFPLFFGLFTFMFLLDTLFPKKSWFHLVIAAGLVFSPYAACWSFWPVNCGAGALLAVAALLRMFREKRRSVMLLYAILAAWSFSVSAATLYFPHIWPCVTLGIVLLVCQSIQIRNEIAADGMLPWRALALLVFLAAAAGLLILFFGSIQDAISIAMNSEAGQRIRLGGLFQTWDLMRGWMFPLTLYENIYSNQCEMQSYQFILLPLFMAFLLRFKDIRNRTVCYALFGFIFYVLVYQYFGIPSWLARVTAWNHCTEPRVSYAIQIAQFLLLAGLVDSQLATWDSKKQYWMRFGISLIAALAVFCLHLFLLWSLPESFLAALHKVSYNKLFLYFFLSALLFFLTVFLLFFKPVLGSVFFALLCFVAGALFNPVCIAPTKISSHVAAAVSRAAGLRFEGRVLLSGNSIVAAHPQYYVMAGGKTLNGFFCYEDPEVFNLLLKALPDASRFHRLSHMTAEFSSSLLIEFAAEIPQGDCIRLKFNGMTYDFSKLPIDFVVNLVYNGNGGLEHNPSVKYQETVGIWQLWRVLPAKSAIP